MANLRSMRMRYPRPRQVRLAPRNSQFPKGPSKVVAHAMVDDIAVSRFIRLTLSIRQYVSPALVLAAAVRTTPLARRDKPTAIGSRAPECCPAASRPVAAPLRNHTG